MRFFHKLRDYIGIDIILQIIGMAALGLLVIGLAVFLWQQSRLPSAEVIAESLADPPAGDGPFVFNGKTGEWYDLDPSPFPYKQIIVKAGEGYLYRPEEDQLYSLADGYASWRKGELCVLVSNPGSYYFVVTAVDLS